MSSEKEARNIKLVQITYTFMLANQRNMRYLQAIYTIIALSTEYLFRIQHNIPRS